MILIFSVIFFFAVVLIQNLFGYLTEHIWLRAELKKNIEKWPSGDSNLRPSDKLLLSDGIFSWYVVQHVVIAYERDSCGKSRIPFGKTEKSIWHFLQCNSNLIDLTWLPACNFETSFSLNIVGKSNKNFPHTCLNCQRFFEISLFGFLLIRV